MDCKRCGTCCEKGGPILHLDDMDFLKKGIVSMDTLQVIRKGELALNPFKDVVEPAPVEMLKIAVQGASWECPFHQKVDGVSGCTIHKDRPLECRILKCWDPTDIEAVTFKDCLNRFDLIGDSNPLRAEITKHEEECAYAKLWPVVEELKAGGDDTRLCQVEQLLARDLAIRQHLVAEFHLNLQQELFYLGQPMFRVMRDEALVISFDSDVVQVAFKRE